MRGLELVDEAGGVGAGGGAARLLAQLLEFRLLLLLQHLLLLLQECDGVAQSLRLVEVLPKFLVLLGQAVAINVLALLALLALPLLLDLLQLVDVAFELN